MPYALSDYADVKFYGSGFEGCPTNKDLRAGKKIDVLKVIENLYPGDYPDVVIQGDPQMGGLFYFLENFHKAKCLRVMWMVDLHNCVGRPEVIKYVKDGGVDLVLKSIDVNNVTEWSKRLNDTGVRVEWYPHSVNTKVFYDRKLSKTYDVTNIGTMSSQCYPTRLKMQLFFTGKNTLSMRETLKLVGGKLTTSKNGIKYHCSNFRGEAYAEDICRSRIFATGCSSYNFLVQKFVEVPACNTLLLSNVPIDAEEMGFKPGVNFAEIKGHPKQVSEAKVEDFLEPIKYYLGHPDEAAKISKRGHDLVHSRHTHEIRAREIVNKISKHL